MNELRMRGSQGTASRVQVVPYLRHILGNLGITVTDTLPLLAGCWTLVVCPIPPRCNCLPSPSCIASNKLCVRRVNCDGDAISLREPNLMARFIFQSPKTTAHRSFFLCTVAVKQICQSISCSSTHLRVRDVERECKGSTATPDLMLFYSTLSIEVVLRSTELTFCTCAVCIQLFLPSGVYNQSLWLF